MAATPQERRRDLSGTHSPPLHPDRSAPTTFLCDFPPFLSSAHVAQLSHTVVVLSRPVEFYVVQAPTSAQGTGRPEDPSPRISRRSRGYGQPRDLEGHGHLKRVVSRAGAENNWWPGPPAAPTCT